MRDESRTAQYKYLGASHKENSHSWVMSHISSVGVLRTRRLVVPVYQSRVTTDPSGYFNGITIDFLEDERAKMHGMLNECSTGNGIDTGRLEVSITPNLTIEA